jgi:two-component system, OmpR family, phosphate regulon sensor histidine kinase PhoR
MKIRFHTRLFLVAVAVAGASLVLAGVLIASSVRRRMNTQIEQHLEAEARLAAEVLSQRPTARSVEELDEEADRIGRLIAARVTLIDATGRVVGDSAEDLAALAVLENHGTRPEVMDARARGVGMSRRYSTTVRNDLLYVAVAVDHPSVAFVRVALSLDQVDRQVASVRNATVVALAAAVLTALVVAWIISAPLGRRVQRIAAAARRYAEGHVSPPAADYGEDELGTVARVLDDSVQALGRQLDELNRDRARMSAILSGMVEGVLVVDALGRVQLLNNALRRMLKIDGDVTGRPYLDVMRHPSILAMLRQALGGGTPDGVEIAPPADTRVFVARAAPAASAAGHGAVLVLHDITDLRRADRMRRDFVANVSHELRTPLTAIRGYVEALADEPDADTREQFLEVIARHTDRMERLVRDLLRLARLDAGQETLDESPCEVAALFRGVTTELAGPIERRRHAVAVRVAPDAATVVGDPAKLHDALRNLVENAVNYSPDGSRIELASERRDGEIALSVADTGPGLPPSDLTRVFERFYRVDRSRARDPGGTGLGLSIVKHLVELHGGRVEAGNQPAGGAIFTVYLRA